MICSARYRRRFLISVCILLAAGLQAQDLPEVKLLDVIVQGNERASAEVIKSTSRLYPGRSLTATDIQRGIKRLWDLGFFANIQVYLESETAEGVVLRIEIEEYPSLEEIIIKGNKRIGKNKILDEIGLKSPQILTDYAISEAVRKIKHLYHEDGYLNVEISTKLESGKKKFGSNLVIKIKENKKVRLRRISFEGNEEVSDLILRRQLKETKIWRWFLFWRSSFSEESYEEDLDKLITYYMNHGYRDARVLEDTVFYNEDLHGLELVVNLYEGNRYYFRNFTWEGNTLHEDNELEERLGIVKGDLYNKEKFDMAIAQKVHPLYMDEGYLYSQIDPKIIPVDHDSLDVILYVTENEKVSVRYINIEGNDKTRDNVIRRELRLHPGETFSYEKLARSQRDIFILNYFENVEPNILPVDEDEIDLSISVVERSSDKANLNVGYTAQYGIIGGGSLEFTNFRGTGQQLSISYNRGTQFGGGSLTGSSAGYRSASIGIVNPWLFDTPNLVGVSAFYSERGRGQSLYFPFDIKQYGGSVRFGRRFRWPDNFFRGAWIFQGSDKQYIGDQEDLRAYLFGIRDRDVKAYKNGAYFVSTIGLAFTQSITRDSRNRPEFPSTGSEFQWTSTLSGIMLGGNEDYHKHVFEFKWYVPTYRKLVLFNMLKLGVIKQVHDPGGRSILPPDEKFYMGGSGIPYGEMLRGYADNSVGPYSDRPQGGNVMLRYSLEFRYPLSENPTVYALVFGDMGNAWLDFSYVDPFRLKRSVGFGVRMFMPMLGMLGLDMGYGFDDTTSDIDTQPQGWEFHFLFGLPF